MVDVRVVAGEWMDGDGGGEKRGEEGGGCGSGDGGVVCVFVCCVDDDIDWATGARDVLGIGGILDVRV